VDPAGLKNSQSAGTLWYHDHALGITRLNVYAGLAGFYIIRDSQDTSKRNNPLGLPAKKYEHAYLIQDRMFKDNGDLFFPAFLLSLAILVMLTLLQERAQPRLRVNQLH
jgi:FtsP/CotA-like multicopper oxidase with cupredoxin domain